MEARGLLLGRVHAYREGERKSTTAGLQQTLELLSARHHKVSPHPNPPQLRSTHLHFSPLCICHVHPPFVNFARLAAVRKPPTLSSFLSPPPPPLPPRTSSRFASGAPQLKDWWTEVQGEQVRDLEVIEAPARAARTLSGPRGRSTWRSTAEGACRGLP